jgi:hypothetical protein
MAEAGTAGNGRGTEQAATVYYPGVIDVDNWRYFAGFALLIVGALRLFDALWASTYNGPTPNNLQHAILGDSLSAYAWLWLFVGIILIVCGAGVLTRNPLSRWLGIAAGALCAVTAIWWMPYYPVWSFTYVLLGFAIVYALATHWASE